MDIVEKRGRVEIVQQNRRGPGRLASRALGRAVGLGVLAAFLLAILAVLIHRSLTGEGMPEDIVGFLLLPPAALAFLIIAAYELSVVLPRRLRIDADSINIRLSPWPLRRTRHLLRKPGQQAHAWKQRLNHYAIYPSGHVSHDPIVSSRIVIRYGGGVFGPLDEDQIASLVDAINIALERTAPTD